MECASGQLVAGHLLLMETHGCSEEAVDIQDILLCSQLYADFKCGDVDKFKSPNGWLKHYEDCMLRAQWTITESHDHKEQPGADAGVSLEALLEACLLTRLSPPDAGQTRQLFTRMAGLASTNPLALQWHRQALKVPDDGPGTSTFVVQFSVLEAPAQLASLFVTFSTRQPLAEHPFAQAFTGRDTVDDIEARFSRRVWDAGKYQPVRQGIRDFLNGKQGSLIVPIPCEVPEGVDQV